MIKHHIVPKVIISGIVCSLMFTYSAKLVFASLQSPSDTTSTAFTSSGGGVGSYTTTQGYDNANIPLVGTQYQISSESISNSNSAANDPQVKAYTGGTTVGGSGSVGAAAGSAAGSLVGCSGSQLLGQVLRNGINNLLGSLTGTLKSQVNRLVPIFTGYDDFSIQNNQNFNAQTAAHTGQITGGIFTGISWDSIAFCIVNSLINDIANKTIQWANSGFNGKPAFIQNPERFFQGLADKQAGQLVSNIAYGAGVNVCQPFRAQLAVGLSQAYGGSYTGYDGYGGARTYNAYGQQASCTMTQIQQNLQNFGVNNVQAGVYTRNNIANYNGYWSAWNKTRADQNNPWGSYNMANDFLSAQINKQQNTAKFELNINKGWFSFKKCRDPKDLNSCDTYTPGSLIQSSLEKTLALPKDRLILATKFDQVVSAIVNNLIKVALHKVLESVKGN
jgi:hypothetical protein